ncbi:hypothetical protein ACED30_20405 [Vibrio splendidus]|uniref:Uncharacterized protein n=1 Tax=Vibrio splendidus TaxID=29497 RepID=A0A0H3ZPX6_VIBSP|nr:hypothetical protein [Vibrio splendidus]AKN38408.1 hypothetical protein [Vibrio splendidus]OEE57369.1 hypothetical protein A147_22990 [Vibrio splendidus FF-6]PTP11427.1 hypothetical protein CWO36_24780 [Vibrio splendidus]
MIIISLESLNIVTEFLKTLNIKSDNIFINDGTASRELVDFEVKCIDFEINGMYQTLDSEYVLHFKDTSITYTLSGNKVEVQPFKPFIKPLSDNMPSEISKFQF